MDCCRRKPTGKVNILICGAGGGYEDLPPRPGITWEIRRKYTTPPRIPYSSGRPRPRVLVFLIYRQVYAPGPFLLRLSSSSLLVLSPSPFAPSLPTNLFPSKPALSGALLFAEHQSLHLVAAFTSTALRSFPRPLPVNNPPKRAGTLATHHRSYPLPSFATPRRRHPPSPTPLFNRTPSAYASRKGDRLGSDDLFWVEKDLAQATASLRHPRDRKSVV